LIGKKQSKIWDIGRLQTTTKQQQDKKTRKKHHKVWDPGGI
jgi:hypothetical protein